VGEPLKRHLGWLSLSDQMRKYTFIKLILFLSLLVGGTEVFAKEFRGIIPLHSTRADVKKILGKPLFEEGKPIDIYDVAEGCISIMYIVQPCHKGLPSNWGNWNLPADTVVEISVSLEKPFKFATLKIPRKQKLKWYTDDTLTTYYHDEEEGGIQ
jgi:hypothetical protein